MNWRKPCKTVSRPTTHRPARRMAVAWTAVCSLLSACSGAQGSSAGAIGPDLAELQLCNAADAQVSSHWPTLLAEARSAGFQHSASATRLREAIVACRPVATAFARPVSSDEHRQIANDCAAGYRLQVTAYEALLQGRDDGAATRQAGLVRLNACEAGMRAFTRAALNPFG